MPVEKLNIPTLPEPQGFVHVGIAQGSRLEFLAGQVAQDGEGQLVGAGDLAAQMEQAMLNVAAGLEAAGATFDDVANPLISRSRHPRRRPRQLVRCVAPQWSRGRGREPAGRGAAREE